MLGKLIKYELKSSARTFIPIYIGLIIVTILQICLDKINYFDIEILSIIVNTVLSGLFVVVFLGNCICIYNRFKKSFFTDEGYLMFTLPVKTSQLINSKIIGSLIWSTLSIITSIISGYIIACGEYNIGIIKAITGIPEIFISVWNSVDNVTDIPTILGVMLIILGSIVLNILFILGLYSMAADSYEFKMNKSKVIYYVKNLGTFIIWIFILFKIVPWVFNTVWAFNILEELKVLIDIMIIIAFEIGIYMELHYRIKNKLNLE